MEKSVSALRPFSVHQALITWRQLGNGKVLDLDSLDGNHIFHLGSRRAERICQHAPARMQRCHRHLVHVRPVAQVDAQFDQGVVSSGTRFQQSRQSKM